MTTVSPYATSAALLILQQANAVKPIDDGTATKVPATDTLIETVKRISGEISNAQLQASAKINSAFLDMTAETDGIVASALDFIQSDRFKSSDPDVKATLTALISENGAGFAMMVKQEQAKNAGVTLDNALYNAITSTIKTNRAAFTDDEFVIGSKFSNGGISMMNIADRDGNSTSNSLQAALAVERDALTASTEAFLTWSSSGQEGPAPKLQDGSGLMDALKDGQNWTSSWLAHFGWSRGPI